MTDPLTHAEWPDEDTADTYATTLAKALATHALTTTDWDLHTDEVTDLHMPIDVPDATLLLGYSPRRGWLLAHADRGAEPVWCELTGDATTDPVHIADAVHAVLGQYATTGTWPRHYFTADPW